MLFHHNHRQDSTLFFYIKIKLRFHHHESCSCSGWTVNCRAGCCSSGRCAASSRRVQQLQFLQVGQRQSPGTPCGMMWTASTKDWKMVLGSPDRTLGANCRNFHWRNISRSAWSCCWHCDRWHCDRWHCLWCRWWRCTRCRTGRSAGTQGAVGVAEPPLPTAREQNDDTFTKLTKTRVHQSGCGSIKNTK